MHKPIRHLSGQTYFVFHENRSGLSSFFDDACCQFFLNRLFNSLRQFHVRIHAYCITPDAVFLLLTPNTPTAISNLLKSVTSQYLDYYRCRFDRQPTGICSSFRSCLILGDRAVLDTQKFVERAPLMRGLCLHAGVHFWSSYCSHAFGSAFSALHQHPSINSYLAKSKHGLRDYRDFIASPFTPERRQQVESRLLEGQVFQDGQALSGRFDLSYITPPKSSTG